MEEDTKRPADHYWAEILEDNPGLTDDNRRVMSLDNFVRAAKVLLAKGPRVQGPLYLTTHRTRRGSSDFPDRASHRLWVQHPWIDHDDSAHPDWARNLDLAIMEGFYPVEQGFSANAYIHKRIMGSATNKYRMTTVSSSNRQAHATRAKIFRLV